ncbi:hypothetical protein [Pseudoroseicyclus sp. CXY001]|uniref:hypothetical protein n=1 Tax=Pseudoroseicyclus sp. CXY001 TaxID=3242492 RepID=UPI0035716613
MTERAKSVCIPGNAKGFSVLDGGQGRSFPMAWQNVCRDLLEFYRKTKQETLHRKRVGWTAIRDDIMAKFDERRPDGKLQRDPMLTRQDLEAWQRGVKLSNVKFQYIDIFARSLLMDPRYDSFSTEAIQSRDAAVLESLSNIYLPRTGNTSSAQIVRETLSGIAITEALEDTWFRHIAIQPLYESSGIFKAIFAYIPEKISDFRRAHFSEVVFFEGYIIPIDAPMESNVLAALADQDLEITTASCLVKLTRAEFKGSQAFGHADGMISLSRLISGEETILAGEVRYPSPILRPSIVTEDIDSRYHEAKEEEKLGTKRTSRTSQSIAEIWKDESDHDFLETFRWNANIAPAEMYEVILGELFSQCYKGYLF